MYFKTLTIKNFLAIGEAKVSLHKRGLVLIEGKNNDETSANSNGAGKSSIVDAICWTLYGVTARGVTNDEVVNKQAGKNCCVSLEVVDGSKTYTISRYRKDKDNANTLLVKSDEADLTMGTVAETQKVVENVIGCSYDVFTSSIYAAQEKMPDLPNMTDKFLKILIEEAAGITKLQNAYEKAKKITNESVAKLELAKSNQNRIHERLKDLKTRKSDLDTKHKDWTLENATSIATKKRSLEELRKKITAESEKILPVKTKADLLSKKTEIKSSMDGIGACKKNAEDAQKIANDAKLDYVAKVTAFKAKGEEVNKIKTEIANIQNKVGTKCSECGKVYEENDLKEAREALQTKQCSLVAEMNAEAVKLRKQKTEVQELLAKATEEAKKIPDATELFAKMEEVNGYLADNEVLMRKIDSLKSDEVKLSDEIEKLRTAKSPYEPMVVGLEADIKTEEVKENEAASLIDALDKEVSLNEAVSNLYSVAGVRAFILDTVTPFLNEKTAEYLNVLSDGKIQATWQTLSTTAKGDIKEKFNIKVTSVNGAKCFAGLSGGEKRKVRVATSMALQDLVASRATKPIDLYIADEVDHALDASGLERLMTILEHKAKIFGTALVISHNSLRDWIDTIITVQKNEGVSTISE